MRAALNRWFHRGPATLRPAAGALALVTAVGLTACGGATPEDPERRPAAAIPVTTTRAAVVDTAERLEAGGVVAAAVSADVSSRVIAPVMDVRVRAGDRVRAGQVLIVLDDRDLAALARQATAGTAAAEQALAAARAEQQAALADQTLAAAWQGRIAALHARNSATSQELDEANARLAGAAARVAAVRARIEQANASLLSARAAADAASTTQSFTVLRAPYDGLVTETRTEPGNLATPGVPLLRLDASGARRVEATLDESRAAYVSVGDAAEVLFDSADGAGTAVSGVVAEVARAASPDARAFTIKVTLPEGSRARSGTFARIRFSGPPRRALVLPASALRSQGQVVTAFVVKDDIARMRLLRTGPVTGDGVEILAGVDAGEVVITAAPPAVTDGARVTLRTAIAQAGGRR